MTFDLTRRGLMGGAAAMAAMTALPLKARAATVLRYGNAGGHVVRQGGGLGELSWHRTIVPVVLFCARIRSTPNPSQDVRD